MATKKTTVQERESEVSLKVGTAPPGTWVALSQDKTRVVGTGLSAQAAAYQARLHGEYSPVLVQMPMEENEGMAAGAH